VRFWTTAHDHCNKNRDCCTDSLGRLYSEILNFLRKINSTDDCNLNLRLCSHLINEKGAFLYLDISRIESVIHLLYAIMLVNLIYQS
jgi:hypothetical protein